jgi:hypothetical protein
MININLDTNKELKEGLLRLGFKKKCGSFLRDYNESLQELGMPCGIADCFLITFS